MKKYILLPLLCTFFCSMQSFGAVTFIMKNYSAQASSQITIPVKVKNFTNIMSIQGTIQFDQTKLAFISVQDFGLSLMTQTTNFGTTQIGLGILTFSWIEGSSSGITLSDSTTIFSISFNVIGAVGTNSALAFVNSPTPFEILDGSANTVAYSWVNGSVLISQTVSITEFQSFGFHLYQNEPNPLADNTNIVFSLPEESIVTFHIYDILGNNVGIFSDIYPAGINTYNLNLGTNCTTNIKSGTYFFKLTSGTNTDIIKMIVIK